MGELKTLKGKTLRVVCDCGRFVHDITGGPDGPKIESYMTAKGDAAPAPPAPVPPKKKGGNVFDTILGGEPEDGEGDDD